MDFGPKSQSKPRENVVPMINVVFLLLIFFLMTAQITPPDPAEISLPQLRHSAEPIGDGMPVLWFSTEGLVDLEGRRDASALAHLDETGARAIILRADATQSASAFAGLLRNLGAQGVSEVTLVAVMGEP